jgi:inhibitor of KinA sporulation pathway (predicted exonuclease)
LRYIVIDFEATCDEPYNPDPQEIIEFPAVAVAVDSGGTSETKEFHTYLRPVAHPKLTDFCLHLTGIGQEQVDRGPSFPEVLGRFDTWLRTECPGDALFVTCGDWDLGSLLPRQCAQHHLPVPAWADRWCNLKRIFARYFPHASDQTHLIDMANSLDLPITGRLHSGIDDARNIARVLQSLLRRGAVIENTAFRRCRDCGAENLLRARECGTCGRALVLLRPGDWLCPRCGCGNFAQRDRCFDCGVARPTPAPASAPRLKPGDWICSRCGTHNFARRRSCFQCGRGGR